MTPPSPTKHPRKGLSESSFAKISEQFAKVRFATVKSIKEGKTPMNIVALVRNKWHKNTASFTIRMEDGRYDYIHYDDDPDELLMSGKSFRGTSPWESSKIFNSCHSLRPMSSAVGGLRCMRSAVDWKWLLGA
ncbi:Uu.00g142150.m01.CDS01 [Anthostomella pinea]|uniref:Uu.00g142150.m01.CDS01 n=1 Tax=Anthostomella pinea TaxID=933095 RepID=A0AAI8VR28_9PEZI|nr:Uu.00g142150.m01.CDS01 [Anthostomella pinea]